MHLRKSSEHMSLVTKLTPRPSKIIFKNSHFLSGALCGSLEGPRSSGVIPEHHADVPHHVLTRKHAAVTRPAPSQPWDLWRCWQMSDGACEVEVTRGMEHTALSVRIPTDLRTVRELGGSPQHICV